MGELKSDILNSLQNGSIRTASRLITRAENADPEMLPILDELFEQSCHTPVLGITGPPGAGKSTLLSRLIDEYRGVDKKVAVLAVDPSSPFTGGAILGDRVRMQKQAQDPGVFIRSMAARDHLGGLASATADALTILRVMNFDLIILETVGVGQSEVDVMRQADQVLVLQNPGAGDEVQAFKAGVLEIGDIYLVNKADLPGAQETAKALREVLSQRANRAMAEDPKVLLVDSLTSNGIRELVNVIEDRFEKDECAESPSSRRAAQLRFHVSQLCQQSINQVLSDLEMTDTTNPFRVAGQVLADAAKMLNNASLK